jgi:2-oxoglutarate ferredoxin oxidoreductase subunit delta
MKGSIHINESLCKACSYCIEACPKRILELASYFNAHGFHPARVIDEKKCTGCALCYQVCPEIAIEVTRNIQR